MRHTCLLLGLAALLTGCVQTGTDIGDKHRVEFPPYDGPKLRVVVVDLENQAEDPRYSELGRIGTGVLKTELGRSGAISLQGRKHMDKAIEEWELSAGDEDVNNPSGAGPRTLRPDVLIYGEIQSFGSRNETGGVPIIWQQKSQIASAKVAIYVKNMHTQEEEVNYGVGEAKITTGGGALAGSSTTRDNTLAERALRMAIYDCWTRMMDQLKSVNPKKPAGE